MSEGELECPERYYKVEGYFIPTRLWTNVDRYGGVTNARCGELCSILPKCRSFEFCLMENENCTSPNQLTPFDVGQCSLYQLLPIEETNMSHTYCEKEGN